MEQRLANSGRISVNEKNFIETALLSGLRVDGRDVYDYRKITINFGRDDGSAEVRLGQTRVMGVVTSQLIQPYKDRPNEGMLSIFTEFSPMADPLFEPGRPGESAVELGRVIDRGLRESRAVDTESLCVLAGKLVWAIRVDLHILDNGGNLVDAANIAALAALSTFRRPECSLGGEDGQEVIVHRPEVREPLPLIIHHLPVAVSFGFFNNEGIVVVDPTHQEENVMTGRMTATLNKNGEVCAIQKAGGEGISQGIIMHCLRVATTKAADITSKIKDAVETCNRERALRKIKRHAAPIAMDVSGAVADGKEKQRKPYQDIGLPGDNTEISKSMSEKQQTDQGNDDEGKVVSKSFKQQGETNIRAGQTKNFIGRPLCWDPYSKGVDLEHLRSSLASRVTLTPGKKQKDFVGYKQPHEAKLEAMPEKHGEDASSILSVRSGRQSTGAKTLKDAVKPKNKRKNKAPSAPDGS